MAKSHRNGGFLSSVFCDCNCIYFQSSKTDGDKWQVLVAIPDVEVTPAQYARGIVSAARNVTDEKAILWYESCSTV
jgi:hypothetical protein